MTRALVVLLALAAAISGWSQDSGVTSVTFDTKDDKKVPVYELTSAAGPESGYLQLSGTAPTFVAPLIVEVENGRHRYQLGSSMLFPAGFDVLATGTPQSWRLDAGNPTLHTAGWIALVTGLVVTAIGVNDWQSSSPLLFKSSDAPLVELAGVAIGAAGITLMLSSRPSAARVR